MSRSQAWVDGYKWNADYPKLLTQSVATCPRSTAGHHDRAVVPRPDRTDEREGVGPAGRASHARGHQDQSIGAGVQRPDGVREKAEQYPGYGWVRKASKRR
jgi:hypothetical protein